MVRPNPPSHEELYLSVRYSHLTVMERITLEAKIQQQELITVCCLLQPPPKDWQWQQFPRLPTLQPLTEYLQWQLIFCWRAYKLMTDRLLAELHFIILLNSLTSFIGSLCILSYRDDCLLYILLPDLIGNGLGHLLFVPSCFNEVLVLHEYCNDIDNTTLMAR